MVENKMNRGRGRPRKFIADEALDKAVRVFWERGYEGADTETLSSEMRLTKPSIYNAFGSKEELFLKALARYKQTISKEPIIALNNAATPKAALHAFFSTIAQDVSGMQHPKGCLLACVALPASERMPNVANLLHEGALMARTQMRAYFERELEKGLLPADFDINAAIDLMRDLTLAMGIRGRKGTPLAELKKIAVRNAELVLIEGNRSPNGCS